LQQPISTGFFDVCPPVQVAAIIYIYSASVNTESFQQSIKANKVKIVKVTKYEAASLPRTD